MPARTWPLLVSLALSLACGPGGGPSVGGDHQDELRQRYRTAPEGQVDAMALEAGVASGQASARELCDLAGLRLLRGDLGGSLELYERALGTDPNDLRVRYNLGQVLARTGRSDDAIRHLQRVVDSEPGFADAHLSLGAAHAQRVPEASMAGASAAMEQDLDRAAYHCSTAVALEPTNPQFLFDLGRVRQLRGEYGRAISAYDRAIGLDSTSIEPYRQLARASAQQGAWERAESALRQVIRLDDDDAPAWFELANVLERRHMYEDAATAYEGAIALRPRHADSHYNLARVLQRLGRRADSRREMTLYSRWRGEGSSLEAARIAVQRDPDAVGPRRALAIAYAEAGEHGLAIRELQVALALDPENPEIYSDRGLLESRLGRPELAIESLRRAVAMAPDSALYQLRLGQALAAGGLYGPAGAAMARAVALDPSSVYRRELARLYLHTSDCSRAVPLLRQVMDADPDDPQVHMELGACAALGGQRDEAVRLLERAIELAPENEQAKDLLDRFRREGPH